MSKCLECGKPERALYHCDRHDCPLLLSDDLPANWQAIDTYRSFVAAWAALKAQIEGK